MHIPYQSKSQAGRREPPAGQGENLSKTPQLAKFSTPTSGRITEQEGQSYTPRRNHLSSPGSPWGITSSGLLIRVVQAEALTASPGRIAHPSQIGRVVSVSEGLRCPTQRSV